MRQHYRLFSDTKQEYRALFHQARQSLSTQLLSWLDDFHCTACPPGTPHPHANNETSPNPLQGFLSESLPPGCGYRAWQEAALHLLENNIARDLVRQLERIEAYKQTVQCHMCGQCCRLASSEDDYKTLQTKAAAGDNFSRQFTSIFLPYASTEAAQERFPEGVAAVLAHIGQTEPATSDAAGVHFYYCPYIGEDNRCTVYGTDKRPGICASYPETPLGFVSEQCAWKPWQNDTHTDTLLTHAVLNLCEHWVGCLHQALSEDAKEDDCASSL